VLSILLEANDLNGHILLYFGLIGIACP
jgi:hypothetical protein